MNKYNDGHIFNCPDVADAEDTIADCLAIVSINEDRRLEIIKNCVKPFELLIELGNLTNAANQDEKKVLVYLMGKMCNSQVKPIFFRETVSHGADRLDHV